MSNEMMKREMQEAVQAGERALQSLYAARDKLGSARNWGIFDMLGGGFISDFVKHSKMNDAAALMEQAKSDIQRFQRELRDVQVSLDLRMEIGSFLSFADFFLDGLVADYMVQSKIADAREKLNFNAISKIMMEKHYDIYPIRDSGKMKLFEYACVLQLKLKKEEYADFIRAITPLIVDLFEQILKLKFNITVANSCDIRKGVETWNIGKLHKNGLFDILNTAYSDRGGFRSCPVYSENLAYIIKDKSSDDTLKGKIDEIISIEKNIRNLAAHQIVSVTEQSVIDKTGKSSRDIMNIIKYLIVQAGVGAGKDDWDTYDKLNQMIITALE